MHIRICTCVYAHRIYITVLVPLTSSRAQPLVGCDKQPHVHTTSESESDSQPRREREKERGKGRGFSSSILKRPPRDGRFDRVLNSRPPWISFFFFFFVPFPFLYLLNTLVRSYWYAWLRYGRRFFEGIGIIVRLREIYLIIRLNRMFHLCEGEEVIVTMIKMKIFRRFFEEIGIIVRLREIYLIIRLNRRNYCNNDKVQ